MKEVMRKELGYDGTFLFPEHHESHAASAFFPSPFDKAAFLTIDGVGEWTTTSYGIGEGNRVGIMADIGFLDPRHPKKLMPRLRRLFARSELEREEVNILRGLLKALRHPVKRPVEPDQPE